MQGSLHRIRRTCLATALCVLAAAPVVGAPSAAAGDPDADGQAAPRAALKLSVSGTGKVRPGGQLRYRLGVRNVGDVSAHDVRVSLTLPRKLAHVRGGEFHSEDRRVVLVVGRLVAGGSRTRDLVVRVKPGVRAGEKIRLGARVSGRSQPAS